MKTSQFGLNTASLQVDDLPGALRAIRAAGFEGVEFLLRHVDQALAGGLTAPAIRRELESLGLRCAGGFRHELRSMGEPEEIRKNGDSLVTSAALIAELGGVNLVAGTDSGTWPSRETCADPLGRIAENLGQVAARMAPLGVNLLLEFNWGMVKSLVGAVEVVRRSGAANVGVLFDPAHYHCTATKAEHLTPEIVAWIRHVHVNNMPLKPAEQTDCNADRVLPGEGGYLDLRALFGRLESNGYAGDFSVEMFSPELRALPVDAAAARMYAAMQTLLP